MNTAKKGDRVKPISAYALRHLGVSDKWFLESEGCIPDVWYLVNEQGNKSNDFGNGYMLGVDVYLVPESKTIKDLYYSNNEKLLFWITGYGSNDVLSIVQKGMNLATLTNRELDDIYTEQIQKSSRYKNMMVYWTKTDVIPENTFELGENWYMQDWLTK